MRILRAFLRADPADVASYTLRMDSLLSADPRELTEFIADAVLSLAARADKAEDPLEWTLGVVREIVSDEGSASMIELARGRWEQILANLTEHGSGGDVGAALARMSREAPWE